MLDEILIDDLVNSPPQIWAQRLRQASVISPLAKRTAVASEDVDRACRVLGLGRRRINQLLTIARDRIAGAPPRGHRTGVHCHLDDPKERVIADAISFAGPAARQKDVSTLVLQLSQARGIEPPSESTVRNRFCAHPDRIDLIDRFELSCDTVVDLCPLALALRNKNDETETAWLLAFVESETARFVHHELYAGKPSSADVSRVIAHVDGRGGGMSCIGVTSSLLNLIDADIFSATVRPRAASLSRKLTGGAVLRAICGRAVGRIHLRTAGRSTLDRDIAPVPIDIARLVIARAIVR